MFVIICISTIVIGILFFLNYNKSRYRIKINKLKKDKIQKVRNVIVTKIQKYFGSTKTEYLVNYNVTTTKDLIIMERSNNSKILPENPIIIKKSKYSNVDSNMKNIFELIGTKKIEDNKLELELMNIKTPDYFLFIITNKEIIEFVN